MTRVNGSLIDHFAVAMAATLVVAAASEFAIAQQLPKNFMMHEVPKSVAAINFEDGHGQTRSLADFKGKVVVLNIWARWCVPCRQEMPALDRLQAILGGPKFEVVPVSIDRGGIETVAKFYAEAAIGNLGMYVDKSGQAVRQLGAVGVPTTLIIDQAGQEIGRVTGPAEWDAPDIAAFFKSIVSGSAGPIMLESRNSRGGSTERDDNTSNAFTRSLQWLRAQLVK